MAPKLATPILETLVEDELYLTYGDLASQSEFVMLTVHGLCREPSTANSINTFSTRVGNDHWPTAFLGADFQDKCAVTAAQMQTPRFQTDSISSLNGQVGNLANNLYEQFVCKEKGQLLLHFT